MFGDLNGFKKGLRAVIRAHKEMEKLKLPKTDRKCLINYYLQCLINYYLRKCLINYYLQVIN